LSWDIVDAMSTVKELTPSPDGTVAAAAEDAGAAADDAGAGAEDDAGGADVVEDEDEQPAATRAATPAAAAQATVLPRLPLPKSIPYPFRHNAPGYADAGHRGHHVCPSALKGRSCGH
jgi:hypothetical protein